MRTPPRFHLSPETWMNDPNGLIRRDGVWHAYFQFNPFGTHWGSLSWGHAVSTDLLEWTPQPVALPWAEGEDVYSGSTVVAPGEVVRAWPDAPDIGDAAEVLVAIYTSHYREPSPRAGTEAQSLAVSVNGGATFIRYAGNPVLDRGSADFRDPKVFRHGERWVMVSVEAVDRQVLVHVSDDLVRWRHTQTFGPHHAVGGAWECPDLVRVPIEGTDTAAWVLLVSINPGGLHPGSGLQYFVGDFDGEVFTPHRLSDSPDPRTFDWFDHGRDCYAAVSFGGVPGRTVVLGWLGNWSYAKTAARDGRRSVLTLPRELSLVERDGRLVVRQRVPAEAAAVPVEHLTLADGESAVRSGVTITFVDGRLSLDRPDAADLPDFGGRCWADVRGGGWVDLDVFADAGTLEIATADGLVWFTLATP